VPAHAARPRPAVQGRALAPGPLRTLFEPGCRFLSGPRLAHQGVSGQFQHLMQLGAAQPIGKPYPSWPPTTSHQLKRHRGQGLNPYSAPIGNGPWRRWTIQRPGTDDGAIQKPETGQFSPLIGFPETWRNRLQRLLFQQQPLLKAIGADPQDALHHTVGTGDAVVPFQPALPRLSPGQGGGAPRHPASGVVPPTSAGVGLNEPKGAAGIA
jgi:hypothetical protein